MDLNNIDKDALRLARSIGLAESGQNGKPNYRAVGDNGTSKGAYQFQEATWKNYAKQVLGDSNSQMTPENQDKVAYGMVKKWKDSGKKPAQIASMWNAGEGRPDAYISHRGTTTINGKQIQYDTPAYAKKVHKYYQEMGAQNPQNRPSVNQPNPIQASTMQTSPVQEEKKGGLLNTLARGGAKVLNAVAEPFVGLASIPVQAGVAKYNKINNLWDGKDVEDPYKKGISSFAGTKMDVSGLSLKEKAGDAIQVGSYFIAPKSLVLAGAMTGGGSAMSDDASLTETLVSTGLGTVTGGIFKFGNMGINHLTKTLPQSIMKGLMPNLSAKQTQNVLQVGVGSPKQLLNKYLSIKNPTGEQQIIIKELQRLIYQKVNRALSVKDVLMILAGGLAGIEGAIVTGAGNAIAKSPTVRTTTAGLLSKLANENATKVTSTLAVPTVSKGLSKGVGFINQ